jgi:hypothetical protein
LVLRLKRCRASPTDSGQLSFLMSTCGAEGENR